MKNHTRTFHRNHILIDVGLISLSVFVSIILARTHALAQLLTVTAELKFVGTFFAGMSFTSIFTAAPAIATLGELSLSQPVLNTALIGAAGALTGDFLLFSFVKDRLSSDVIEILRYEGALRRVQAIFRKRFFRWLTPLIGALVIASPLPDELGVAMLGFSKIKKIWFVVLSFTFNFLGILGIGLIAHTLAGA